MAEETLRRNLQWAFDPGPNFPNPLLLSRTMAMLDERIDADKRDQRSRTREAAHLMTYAGPPRWLALAAALIAAIVIVTLLYGAQALRQYRNQPSNAARLGTVVAPLTSQNWAWYFTPNDAAVLLDETNPKQPSEIVDERMLVTHDGGQHWLSTRMPDIVGPAKLAWVDPVHMVYVGLPGEIETTADGGLHWTHVNRSSLGQLDPSSTYFLNTQEGWTLQSNTVSRTMDSGATWQQVATVITDRTAPVGQFLFTDPLHGFMAGNSIDGVGRLFRTSDGGQTWNLVQLPAPSSGWPASYGTVDVPTFFGQQGFTLYTVSGLGLYAYFTADGGSTWSKPRPFPNYPSHPTFINASDGWALDLNGLEHRSVDGGISWLGLNYSLPGYVLRTIVPVGGEVLWGTASQLGSQITYGVRSTDGGVSWSFMKVPGP
jgi:photosystem II stability/assembly factor-like uncharacterized protein